MWAEPEYYKDANYSIYKYDVFLICPVRNATDEQKQKLQEYIQKLENEGKRVYYPARDTNQDDPIGYRICRDNRHAIYNSETIHIFWDKNSTGSLFDLGMAFMAEKPLIIVDSATMVQTPHKSFENMMIEWERHNKGY